MFILHKFYQLSILNKLLPSWGFDGLLYQDIIFFFYFILKLLIYPNMIERIHWLISSLWNCTLLPDWIVVICLAIYVITLDYAFVP